MGIGWEKPVFGWIQKLQIQICIDNTLIDDII